MKPLNAILLISLFIRLLLAAFLEFGNDEVYYYSYALHLQSNYFDHPPGVAYLIRLSTLNMWLQDELFVRLGAIICAAIGTVLTYKIGALIKNKRIGLFAAVLYNTSIYSSIIAGVFILPDSPQVVFWLAALWVSCKIINSSVKNQPVPLLLWIGYGILAGLCMLCKVHGVFLWLGLGGYVIFTNRKLLSHPGLYLAAIISLIVFSPVIFWNIENNFITWSFHSNRVNHGIIIKPGSFFQAFFGQIFYNNPINVFLIVVALCKYQSKHYIDKPYGRLLLFTGLPIILITTGISLFNHVLPHWSGPGFFTLSLIAATYLDSITRSFIKTYPLVLKASTSFVLIVAAFGLLAINFYPGTMGKQEIKNFGKNDFTLDMWGWQEFEKQFSTYLNQRSDFQTGQPLKIVCNKWFPAAHIDYYVARPLKAEVVGLGNLVDLHHYAWLNKYRTEIAKGEDALCIVPSNYPEDVEGAYNTQFASIKLLKTFCLERGGKPARYVSVYLLKNYSGRIQVGSQAKL